MTVTARLLQVFLVDKQLRGLQSRLRGAERFLEEQSRQLASINERRAAIEGQIRLAAAQAADREGESNRLLDRVNTVRKQMESATTNKEYKAFLTELNTFKLERDRLDQEALEFMAKADELRKQLEELSAQQTDRTTIRDRATLDRDQRHAEIQQRLGELKAERQRLASDVPAEAMRTLERLEQSNGEEAMAPVEVLDRRRKEFSCGACRMAVPFEAVSLLFGRGVVTTCASCGCILYLEESVTESLSGAGSKR